MVQYRVAAGGDNNLGDRIVHEYAEAIVEAGGVLGLARSDGTGPDVLCIFLPDDCPLEGLVPGLSDASPYRV